MNSLESMIQEAWNILENEITNTKDLKLKTNTLNQSLPGLKGAKKTCQIINDKGTNR